MSDNEVPTLLPSIKILLSLANNFSSKELVTPIALAKASFCWAPANPPGSCVAIIKSLGLVSIILPSGVIIPSLSRLASLPASPVKLPNPACKVDRPAESPNS